MAVELRFELDQVTATSPAADLLTGVAVFDGAHWASLCREYDIASVGATAHEALLNLQDAVREALATAAKKQLSAGRPVPDRELRTFMRSHKEGQGAASIVRLTV